MLRRASPSSWCRSGPLLALSASCLWGCPQLLSDEFMLSSPALSGQVPPDSEEAGAAGVAGQSGSTGSAQNASGAGGAGGAPSVPAVGPPSVLSVSPSNGTSGVAADAVVTLTFSEPMNTSSVEAAYSSTEMAAASVAFSWSAGDTVLQITPAQPLAQASGSSPTATVARRYALEIGTTAVDRAGEALPRFSTSFSTLRAISQTLAALQDRNLTGNWRSDDVYGDNTCQFADPSGTTCIGDSSNGNATYRGFVTFDLSSLPAEVQGLSAARLALSVDDVRGTPFSDLGSLLAEHVSFDSISLTAFQSAALGSALQVSTSATPGTQLSLDVLSSVQEDLAARAHTQFRFRFSSLTNSDDEGDLLQAVWATEQLQLTYLLP